MNWVKPLKQVLSDSLKLWAFIINFIGQRLKYLIKGSRSFLHGKLSMQTMGKVSTTEKPSVTCGFKPLSYSIKHYTEVEYLVSHISIENYCTACYYR